MTGAPVGGIGQTLERAWVYEELGRNTRAPREYETLYAEDPSYEDVAERLGV